MHMDCQDNVQVESIQGEIVEYPEPPPGVKVLKNGAGYANGRIAYGPGTYGPNPTAITKENTQLFHQRRLEKAVQAASQGMVKALPGNGKTEFDAWVEINRAQTALAMSQERGRASTEAAKFVGNAARLLPDRRRADNDNGTGDKITVQIPEHIVIAMLQAARRSDDE